jgi:hypothetical protein
MLLSAESLLSTPAERARRSAVVPAVPDVGDACSSYIARSAHPFLPAALMRAADGTIKSLAPAFVVSVNGKVSPCFPASRRGSCPAGNQPAQGIDRVQTGEAQQLNLGDILIIDRDLRVLFRITPTGERTILSDLKNADQGPLGEDSATSTLLGHES